MAIKIAETYQGRTAAPNENYPTGSFTNESLTGANDGTPVEQHWCNDWLGSRDAILHDAGLKANGKPEKVGNSQVLDSIKRSTGKMVFGDYPVDLVAGLVITPANNQYPKLSAFNTIYELADNSDSYTVKSFAQSVGGECVITLSDDTPLIAKKVDTASRQYLTSKIAEINGLKVQQNVEVGTVISSDATAIQLKNYGDRIYPFYGKFDGVSEVTGFDLSKVKTITTTEKSVVIQNIAYFNPQAANLKAYWGYGQGVEGEDDDAIQAAFGEQDLVEAPIGFWYTVKTVIISGNKKLYCLGVNQGRQGYGFWLPKTISSSVCHRQNLTVFGNRTNDFLTGTGTFSVRNGGFTGVVGSDARFNSTTCFKPSTAQLGTVCTGTKITGFKYAGDYRYFSYGHSFTDCTLVLNQTALDFGNDPFTVTVSGNNLNQNDIGVIMGAGAASKVTDNNFSLDGTRNQIGIKNNNCSAVDYSRNYFEDYGQSPAVGHGGYAYWLSFNSYQYPNNITLKDNIVNMGMVSDHAIRITQNNKKVRLPINTILKDNIIMGVRTADVFVESDANIAIDLRGLTVTNRPILHSNKYACTFNDDGTLSKGSGITGQKLATGQYRLKRDSFSAGFAEITCTANAISVTPVLSMIQATTNTHVDLLFTNTAGVPVDTPFAANIQEV